MRIPISYLDYCKGPTYHFSAASVCFFCCSQSPVYNRKLMSHMAFGIKKKNLYFFSQFTYLSLVLPVSPTAFFSTIHFVPYFQMLISIPDISSKLQIHIDNNIPLWCVIGTSNLTYAKLGALFWSSNFQTEPLVPPFNTPNVVLC